MIDLTGKRIVVTAVVGELARQSPHCSQLQAPLSSLRPEWNAAQNVVARMGCSR